MLTRQEADPINTNVGSTGPVRPDFSNGGSLDTCVNGFDTAGPGTVPPKHRSRGDLSLLQCRTHRSDRLVGLGRVRPAALRHVGTAAAALPAEHRDRAA